MATTPVPPSLVKAFAALGARNAIPIVPTVTPGQASFDLGFPPITMPDPTASGIPPDGKDMNGILYMLSAHIVWIQAGGCYPFNSNVISVVGGYALGAVIQSAADTSKFFLNVLNGNTNNPDSVITGWVAFSPTSSVVGLQTTVLPSGTSSDLALAAGVAFLDLNPTTGAADLTGIASANAINGQYLTVTNVNGSNLVTLKALDVGSAASARFRLPADITLPQYSNATFRKSSALGLWIPAS